MIKHGYQVFEISPSGCSHSVSKVYPTLLGCKRVLNRIREEHICCEGYRYVLKPVFITSL